MTTTDLPDAAIAAAFPVLTEHAVPGAAIALKIDEDAVVTAGVGSSDLAGEVPMPSAGRFPLYSITKMILSTAALRLVEAGSITLEADVRGLVPEAALAHRITLRQLLNHTAGLPDYGAMPGYIADLRANPAKPWTDEDFLDRTLALGTLFAPGEGWAYSNVGYLLVRRIVEVLGNDGSLQATLGRLVFGPAGVGGMAVATSPADMASLVPGYSVQLETGGAMRDVRSRYHPGWVAHGLVTATAADTARLVGALFDGDLLDSALLREMLRGVTVAGSHPPFHPAGYGLGLMLDLAPGKGLVAGHAGGGPGYSTAAFRFEGTDGRRVTSVALVNLDAGDAALHIAFAVGRDALENHD